MGACLKAWCLSQEGMIFIEINDTKLVEEKVL